MVTPIDPTSLAFLLTENRTMPMHVGGLALYEPPEGADSTYPREVYQAMIAETDVAPIFLKHPYRSVRTAGQWTWKTDDQFDIEHHVRHSALPQPGRVRELLELCSRLHGARLARERPLWEAHVIEGLDDGRFAIYTKLHHALVDGISAMRLLQTMMSEDPTAETSVPWARRERVKTNKGGDPTDARDLAAIPLAALRQGLGIAADAAGLPAALVKTLTMGIKNETSALSLYAPHTMFNVEITGARRFAAQGWPLERLRGIAKASGTTLNDVVLAMCSGAVRAYLQELNALPETGLVAMVPIGLEAKNAGQASDKGGNAVGSVMCKLGTELKDPAARLAQIHGSMNTGKEALQSMTPNQIVAMSALGMAPSIIGMLKLNGLVRPPFNLIISNVPGPRKTLYMNGAKMVGTYPLSIPMQGMALNITCNSYDQDMEFGLTGCRRSVPHLQRLLTYLDDEVTALEKATG